MSAPRLGFLGLGWIGRHRMRAILDADAGQAVAITDPSPDAVREAATIAPGAAMVDGLDAMLALGLDGVVIATPSAMHAAQAIKALDHGVAVFCQKPLGRSAAEAEAVVAAARRADRRLGLDLSYRHTLAMVRLRDLVRSGGIGRVFAGDLTFHNAYGPDKPWFYDVVLAGGGCVMDLGVHLIDLALWVLDFPEVIAVESHLRAGGEPLAGPRARVEDFCLATLALEGGVVLRLACSWKLHAGRDAEIGASFWGTEGGAAMRNADGSFYDFTAEHNRQTHRELLASPPDDWGGRAAIDWAKRIGDGFDAEAERFVTVARVIDRIYDASRQAAPSR
ncbi:Gfo/Idh/MocA family protein [Plastoroseomonas arctica]|uniref:Gfo/Idh/MocA family oxidoreductase n=1 Tax=Plastoroseomonas arctica TaxID=1509237 RepID=A0AAF1K0Q4_9PROT|nr:Gfo/Idh/MocA family oxidoreductase [Plastoroseomonas arctica]MBR0654170.1 Gfo/Idh/MocA family oxidoreductase [Plastoroseomonas arctica]